MYSSNRKNCFSKSQSIEVGFRNEKRSTQSLVGQDSHSSFFNLIFMLFILVCIFQYEMNFFVFPKFVFENLFQQYRSIPRTFFVQFHSSIFIQCRCQLVVDFEEQPLAALRRVWIDTSSEWWHKFRPSRPALGFRVPAGSYALFHRRFLSPRSATVVSALYFMVWVGERVVYSPRAISFCPFKSFNQLRAVFESIKNVN